MSVYYKNYLLYGIKITNKDLIKLVEKQIEKCYGDIDSFMESVEERCTLIFDGMGSMLF